MNKIILCDIISYMYTRIGKNFKRGFTLIELLVVFSIWAVITGIAVTEYVNFRHYADFDNAVQNVALSMREMQIYGLGSKESGTGSGNFSEAYGMHFQIDFTGGGNGSDDVDDLAGEEIITFIDKNDLNPPYGVFTVGVDTLIEKTIHPEAFYLNSLCLTSGGITTCNGNEPHRLDITFKRPRADARVSYDGNLAGGDGLSYDEATIEFGSVAGDSKTIHVYSTGQISVD